MAQIKGKTNENIVTQDGGRNRKPEQLHNKQLHNLYSSPTFMIMQYNIYIYIYKYLCVCVCVPTADRRMILKLSQNIGAWVLADFVWLKACSCEHVMDIRLPQHAPD